MAVVSEPTEVVAASAAASELAPAPVIIGNPAPLGHYPLRSRRSC